MLKLSHWSCSMSDCHYKVTKNDLVIVLYVSLRRAVHLRRLISSSISCGGLEVYDCLDRCGGVYSPLLYITSYRLLIFNENNVDSTRFIPKYMLIVPTRKADWMSTLAARSCVSLSNRLLHARSQSTAVSWSPLSADVLPM
jgi:hypothetical protein